MKQSTITLAQAVKFHGHLGPFLVLGLRIGNAAIRKLKAERYFGILVSVEGADKKPKSCLIDGLQLATGATFGKGNIEKIGAKSIKVRIKNLRNNKRIVFKLKHSLIEELDSIKTHSESEKVARRLYGENESKLFDFK